MYAGLWEGALCPRLVSKGVYDVRVNDRWAVIGVSGRYGKGGVDWGVKPGML